MLNTFLPHSKMFNVYIFKMFYKTDTSTPNNIYLNYFFWYAMFIIFTGSFFNAKNSNVSLQDFPLKPVQHNPSKCSTCIIYFCNKYAGYYLKTKLTKNKFFLINKMLQTWEQLKFIYLVYNINFLHYALTFRWNYFRHYNYP